MLSAVNISRKIGFYFCVWLESENALKTQLEITTTATSLTQNQHTQQQNHHTN
jgi:hypothetical protein